MKQYLHSKPTVYFYRQAYSLLKSTVGKKPCETLGLIFGDRRTMTVKLFVYDPKARATVTTCSPSVEYFNPIIKAIYESLGWELLGFVHSHPEGNTKLSAPDISYIKTLFKATNAPYFICPIVQSEADTDFSLHPYLLLPEDPHHPIPMELSMVEDSHSHTEWGIQDYTCLQGAVDLIRMKTSKVVAIGSGGGMTVLSDLVRSGLGSLTVIDPDTVEEKNVTRADFVLADVGLPKTYAVERRLRSIDPTVHYCGINDDICQMKMLELEAHFTDCDLILAMTDSFAAQSYANLIALHFKKPIILAGLYPNGRAAEIFFSIPGVTPSCLRCAVEERYQLQRAGSGDPPSSGSTIFHTHMLDAAIGMLALAILHRDTEGYHFSNWFGDSFDRNFVQIRLHPEYSAKEGKLFHKRLGERGFVFDTLFQQVTPNCPPDYAPCPDCGGTENLSAIPDENQERILNMLSHDSW